MASARDAGFSMIELLISILVLAIGMLGAGAIQLAALRTSQQSSLHSIGVQLAAALAARMRANDAQMQLASADNPFLDLDISNDQSPSAAPAVNCYAASCDPQQLALFDMYEWQQRLREALPGARAVVCRDDDPWHDTSRRLAWDCTDDESASVVIKVGWAAKDPSGKLATEVEGASFPEIALLVAPYAP